MPYLITEDAHITCAHILGVVDLDPSQHLVTIQGRAVLVEPDPEGRPIHHCPNIGATIKPCTHTLKVKEGYSDLVRIQGRRACLETVTGLTDGTPPGAVTYGVRDPGQRFVTSQL
jgi:hypothetical protein